MSYFTFEGCYCHRTSAFFCEKNRNMSDNNKVSVQVSPAHIHSLKRDYFSRYSHITTSPSSLATHYLVVASLLTLRAGNNVLAGWSARLHGITYHRGVLLKQPANEFKFELVLMLISWKYLCSYCICHCCRLKYAMGISRHVRLRTQVTINQCNLSLSELFICLSVANICSWTTTPTFAMKLQQKLQHHQTQTGKEMYLCLTLAHPSFLYTIQRGLRSHLHFRNH